MLLHFGLSFHLCCWILDFLTSHLQYVRLAPVSLSTSSMAMVAIAKKDFLHVLKRYNLHHKVMQLNFYSSAIESFITYGLPAWYTGYSVADKKARHRVIRWAEKNHWLLSSLTGRHPIPFQSKKYHKRLLTSWLSLHWTDTFRKHLLFLIEQSIEQLLGYLSLKKNGWPANTAIPRAQDQHYGRRA